MKTAGCWSTRVMPTRRAAPGPRTRTRSARCECPASKNRPVSSSACTARKAPGDAALIGSWIAPAARGSLSGTERTSAPRTSTSEMVPAAATPLRRRRRASASQGRTVPPAPPPRAEGLMTTSVAESASNRPTIWLPAVLESPSVATSAPTPMTVPSTVSATREGGRAGPRGTLETRSAVCIRARGTSARACARRARPPGRRALTARPPR